VTRPAPSATLALIVRAEQHGVSTAWSTVGGTTPDAVTLFAAAAARTYQILLGTAIVPIYPRHPLVLASQALVLADLAPGRVRLGLGPSHRLGTHSPPRCRSSEPGMTLRAPEGGLTVGLAPGPASTASRQTWACSLRALPGGRS
jgi:alkanesulfonate monooxygenase SsuD/methylene tetrahydromethanopterin reductase-like flavin-dependent oxidoreductase (luciferase family)